MQRGNDNWWMQFVMDHKPAFIVERENFLAWRTCEGYPLTETKIEWFKQNDGNSTPCVWQGETFFSNVIHRKIASLMGSQNCTVHQRR